MFNFLSMFRKKKITCDKVENEDEEENKINKVIFEIEYTLQMYIKTDENINTYLIFLKNILLSDNTILRINLTNSIKNGDTFIKLLINLDKFSLETKNDFTFIMRNLISFNECNFIDEFIVKNNIITFMLQNYNSLHIGAILRECADNKTLIRLILDDNEFYRLFKHYIIMDSFDIASDAFFTLETVLTSHQDVFDDFIALEDNYDKFFSHYEILITSEKYAAKIQSLVLLSTILTRTDSYILLNKVTNDKYKLRIIMNILPDISPVIRLKVFNIFKLFITNPKKDEDVQKILYRNSKKIISFLYDNYDTHLEDENFCNDRAYVILILNKIKLF